MTSKDWVSAKKQDKNSDQIDVPNLSFGNNSYTKLTFGDLYDIKNGINKSKEYFGKGNKILNYMDVNKSVKNDENSIKGLIQISDEEYERYNVQNNDLFFTRTSETSEEIGLTSAYRGNFEKCIFSGFILRARPIKEFINSLYFAYYLRSPKMRNEIIKLSSITTRALISGKNLSTLKVKIPDINEQEKVANFFSLVDKKIELMERKQDRLVKYKGGLLQKIFSEKSKLYTSKIGEIFEERSEKGFSDLELLSVTLKDGVIKRSDIESKDNSNINKDNYKHVLPGDIVYNSMRMWQGASGVSEFEGIVSPAYTILKSNNNENSYYFAYYFKTHKMINQFKKYSQGLTSDTWNLKYPLISEISIKIHPFKEQEKIADFLSKVDNKIDSVEQQLEKTKEFKKYLLQQMFV